MHHANGVVWEAVSPEIAASSGLRTPPPDSSLACDRVRTDACGRTTRGASPSRAPSGFARVGVDRPRTRTRRIRAADIRSTDPDSRFAHRPPAGSLLLLRRPRPRPRPRPPSPRPPRTPTPSPAPSHLLRRTATARTRRQRRRASASSRPSGVVLVLRRRRRDRGAAAAPSPASRARRSLGSTVTCGRRPRFGANDLRVVPYER